MNKKIHLAAAAVVSLLFAPSAFAIAFDFAPNALDIQQTSSATFTDESGIIATAYEYDGSSWIKSELWARNDGSDHGLGVCSAGEADCTPKADGSLKTGGGDRNELSNQANLEAILLELPLGFVWDEIWVSSLDSGGTGGSEEGALYYGDTDDVAALLTGDPQLFNYDSNGINVEGELSDSIIDAVSASKYLLFTHLPREDVGTDNDYLVWKGVITRDPEFVPGIPEPTTLALMGLGLAGIGYRRLSSKKAA